jgi:very-short-patch-repair endonuclease
MINKSRNKSTRHIVDIPELSIKLEPEFKFHPTRKWRADYIVQPFKILIEVDGGIWTGGRHSGGAGQIKDMEKLNAAAVLGYLVLRYTPQQFNARLFIKDLKEML